jgi:hypothetical protein
VADLSLPASDELSTLRFLLRVSSAYRLDLCLLRFVEFKSHSSLLAVRPRVVRTFPHLTLCNLPCRHLPSWGFFPLLERLINYCHRTMMPKTRAGVFPIRFLTVPADCFNIAHSNHHRAIQQKDQSCRETVQQYKRYKPQIEDKNTIAEYILA